MVDGKYQYHTSIESTQGTKLPFAIFSVRKSSYLTIPQLEDSNQANLEIVDSSDTSNVFKISLMVRWERAATEGVLAGD
jgi:hypothetical protein